MRALIVTVVTATAAAAVVAAVLLPRVVDGEAVQAELRRVVREATGQDVAVRGRIGIDLLPRPRLSLARVVVGNPVAAAGGPLAEIDRIDLEVAPLAFVAGRLEFRRALVVRPRVTFAAAPPGLAQGLLRALANPSLAALAAVDVVDGRAELTPAGPRAEGRPGRRPGAIAHLEAVEGGMRRDALLGRLAVTLAGRAGDVPLSLEGEIGDPAAPGAGTAASSLRFELLHGAAGRRARLDFRGFGALGGDAPSLKGEFELEATDPAALLRLAGLVRELPPASARTPRTAPLLFQGQVGLEGRTLRLDEVVCRLGANTVGGRLELAFGAEVPHLVLTLEGTEFLLDDVGVEDLGLLAASPWWEGPLTGGIGLRLGLVRWRDQPIRQLRLEATLGGDGAPAATAPALIPANPDGTARIERLTATLPGGTDLSIAGTLRRRRGGVPAFDGSLSLAAEDARGLLAALGLDLAAMPEDGLKTLALTSGLAASSGGLTLREFELRLDAANVTGSAALVAGPRPRLALSAAADRLNLGAYLPRPGSVDGGRLRERLTALDAAVDLAIERVSLGELRGEDLYLRASLDQGLLRLGELRVRDLAEARLRLSGSGDLPVASFQLEGEIETARPTRFLRALGVEPPPTVTRFAPVRLGGTARGTREGTTVELALDASGLDARLGGEVGPWFDLASGDLELNAEAAQLGDSLRNLGLGPPGGTALARPLRLAARVRRDRADPDRLAVSFEGDAPPSRVEGRLGLRRDEGLLSITGDIAGPTLDPNLLGATLALSGRALPPPAGWLGRLPAAPLSLDRLRGLNLDLALGIDRVVDAPAGTPQDASVRLRATPERLSLDELRMGVAGGELSGVLSVDAESDSAVVGLDLGLRGADPAILLPLLGVDAAGLAGELDLGLRLAGGGGDLVELFGSLEGDGEIRLDGGEAAPTRLAGSLVAQRGIVASRPPGLALATATADGSADVSLDLLAWMAEIGLRLTPHRPPPSPDAEQVPPPLPAAPLPPVERRFLGRPDRLVEVVPRPAAEASEPGVPAPTPTPIETTPAIAGPSPAPAAPAAEATSPTAPASAPAGPTPGTPPT